ncbi:nuclear transport factor 2 family protein [Chitinimonas sp. PSY-7]|uniref:nuclear transport factor 2 family protein n=1 Tax=Chitinimonas sp. PSY-7 TaxID=3459088 RepID=UPI0040401BB3
MTVNAIREFLGTYFEVLQTQDLGLFDQVFHPGCVLYSQQDGATVVRPLPECRRMVEGRHSPQSGGFPRNDEILMVDVLSPDMALAKVRLRLFDSIMVDYLNLMRVDGQWRVVAKHFHRDSRAVVG